MALLILLLFNALMSPGFFAITLKNGQVYGSLIDIALRASPLILVSLGMTLVIATGGIDLSVGTVAALAASVAAACFAHSMPLAQVLIFALACGGLVGFLNSILIMYFGIQPIISSLIAMVTGRGLAQLLVGGQIIPLSNQGYLFFGSGAFLGLPLSIWLALLAFLLLACLVRKSALGLFIEAFGANPRAAFYSGLNTNSIQISVYVISGLMAAASGILMSANIHAVDVNNLGLYLELDAILAVVIGGTRLTGGRFSLAGSVLGALIIQTVSTTINTQGIAVEAMLMVKAAVVIAICLMQSPPLKNYWQNFWQKPKVTEASGAAR